MSGSRSASTAHSIPEWRLSAKEQPMDDPPSYTSSYIIYILFLQLYAKPPLLILRVRYTFHATRLRLYSNKKKTICV